MDNIKSIQMLNKVPAVTLFFWIIKIMATTIGETGADYLAFNMHMGIALTTAIMSFFFLIALVTQLSTKSYTPWIYWLSVVLISILGTLITDNLVDNLKVSLVTTTIGFTIGLAAIFYIWYSLEKTLSIHSIFTRQRELFYWLAILFSFALGTSAGDLFSEYLNLGYRTSALIFGGSITVIAAIYYIFKQNPVLCFWLAYILTRPFGAAIGDYLSQSNKYGGLGFGAIHTSEIFLGIIFGFIAYFTFQKKKSELTIQ